MSTGKEGAAAEQSSSTEYEMTLTMSVGCRPNRSAAHPKRSAPTGRIANVSEIASVTAFTWQ